MRCAVPSSKVGSGAFDTSGRAGPDACLAGVGLAAALAFGAGTTCWACATPAKSVADNSAAEARASGRVEDFRQSDWCWCIPSFPPHVKPRLSDHRSPACCMSACDPLRFTRRVVLLPTRKLWPPDGHADDFTAQPARLSSLDRHPDRVQPDRDGRARAARPWLHRQASALPVSRPAADGRLCQDGDLQGQGQGPARGSGLHAKTARLSRLCCAAPRNRR